MIATLRGAARWHAHPLIPELKLGANHNTGPPAPSGQVRLHKAICRTKPIEASGPSRAGATADIPDLRTCKNFKGLRSFVEVMFFWGDGDF